MAVAFVQVYQGKDESGSATGITLSSVDGTAGNLIVIDVTWRNNASQTLNTITFNGSSIIGNEIGSQLNSSGGSTRSFWVNGSLANASVIVGMSASVPTIQASAHVYSGTHASTPIGNVQTSTGTGTNTATAANTGADADDIVHDVLSVRVSPGTITQGADQTIRATQDTASTLHLRTSTQPGTASDDTMSYSWTSSQAWAHKAYVIEAGSGVAPPSITNVNTTNSVTLEDSSFLINGTDFDNTAPKATAEIRQGDFTYALTASAQDATSYTTAMPATTSGSVAPKIGSATFAIINDDAQEDTQAVTITAETGMDYVDVGTPSTDPDATKIETTPPAETGDQFQWRVDQVGFDETNFRVNDDLTCDFDEGLLLENVEGRMWDHDDSKYGAWVSATLLVSSGAGNQIILNRRRGRR